MNQVRECVSRFRVEGYNQRRERSLEEGDRKQRQSFIFFQVQLVYLKLFFLIMELNLSEWATMGRFFFKLLMVPIFIADVDIFLLIVSFIHFSASNYFSKRSAVLTNQVSRHSAHSGMDVLTFGFCHFHTCKIVCRSVVSVGVL